MQTEISEMQTQHLPPSPDALVERSRACGNLSGGASIGPSGAGACGSVSDARVARSKTMDPSQSIIKEAEVSGDVCEFLTCFIYENMQ